MAYNPNPNKGFTLSKSGFEGFDRIPPKNGRGHITPQPLLHKSDALPSAFPNHPLGAGRGRGPPPQAHDIPVWINDPDLPDHQARRGRPPTPRGDVGSRGRGRGRGNDFNPDHPFNLEEQFAKALSDLDLTDPIERLKDVNASYSDTRDANRQTKKEFDAMVAAAKNSIPPTNRVAVEIGKLKGQLDNAEKEKDELKKRLGASTAKENNLPCSGSFDLNFAASEVGFLRKQIEDLNQKLIAATSSGTASELAHLKKQLADVKNESAEERKAKSEYVNVLRMELARSNLDSIEHPNAREEVQKELDAHNTPKPVRTPKTFDEALKEDELNRVNRLYDLERETRRVLQVQLDVLKAAQSAGTTSTSESEALKTEIESLKKQIEDHKSKELPLKEAYKDLLGRKNAQEREYQRVAALIKNSDDSIGRLKTEIQTLKRVHQKEMIQMKAEHVKEMDKLKADHGAHLTDIQKNHKLKAQYDARLTDIQKNYDRVLNNELQKQEHAWKRKTEADNYKYSSEIKKLQQQVRFSDDRFKRHIEALAKTKAGNAWTDSQESLLATVGLSNSMVSEMQEKLKTKEEELVRESGVNGDLRSKVAQLEAENDDLIRQLKHKK